MLYLGKTFRSLARQQLQWERLLEAATAPSRADRYGVSPDSHLDEVRDFGTNPGALRMLTYVPPRLTPAPALVVVLHGCTQTAEGYDLGAGWSTLADRYGFVLLLPQQQPSNNPNNCFSWFRPGDTRRGRGEANSIAQMVKRAIRNHGIDRRRVYVTGLSAGGAMTSVMLATYPDLFAAGAIVAGLPYGAAASVQEAFSSMSPGRSRRSEEWGDLVRQASKHRGPWPRVSVWHGTADTTVSPANADEIVKQWTAVHGLPSGPTRTERVNEYSRHVWCSETGDEVIESFTVTGMAHGTPLATGDADDQCGSPGDFMLDVGISSSFHIAKFWGLTGDRATVTGPITVAPEPEEPLRAADGFGRPVPEPDRAKAAGPRPGHSHGIIMRALEAAGLMRRQD